MGYLLNYSRLSWAHPLRRLAEFRLPHEKEPGGDTEWCHRMKLSPKKKNTWWHHPDRIKFEELITVCCNLKLSPHQVHWVLAAGLCRCKKGHEKEPLGPSQYIRELLNRDVATFFPHFAAATILVICHIGPLV